MIWCTQEEDVRRSRQASMPSHFRQNLMCHMRLQTMNADRLLLSTFRKAYTKMKLHVSGAAANKNGI